MDLIGILGLIPIIRDFIPKKSSMNVRQELNRSGSIIYFSNLSDSDIQIQNIQINNKEIKGNFFVIEKDKGTNFRMNPGSNMKLTVGFGKGDDVPKSIQFFIKSRFSKNQKLEYFL
jgi:hypothetical protein